MKIGKRLIGDGHPCYIVAEVSANHGGRLSKARDLMYAIKESGADAVKLQTYTADTITLNSDRPEFQIGEGTLWSGSNLHRLYSEACTPWEWHAELFELAASLQLDCFSSPFDTTAVDFLEAFNPPAYKIASFELVDIPLIEYVAAKGRPLIMSTGMASLEEIEEAVAAVKRLGAPFALLKCTSAYPALASSMNLRTIPFLKDRFQVPIGLSDHSMSAEVPIVAVGLGANIIEKHFTLSRDEPGPDSAFSLEPVEFRNMVDSIRQTEEALGEINLGQTDSEKACRQFRRSLYVVKEIKAGERFTSEHLRSVRPANGLPPKFLSQIIGQIATRDISAGTPLSWDLCENVDEP